MLHNSVPGFWDFVTDVLRAQLERRGGHHAGGGAGGHPLAVSQAAVGDAERAQGQRGTVAMIPVRPWRPGESWIFLPSCPFYNSYNRLRLYQ